MKKKNKKENQEYKPERINGLYDYDDLTYLQDIRSSKANIVSMQTLDELLERDKQRDEDGFPRRIHIGKVSKPGPGKKDTVIIVPTTTEPKFYHHTPYDEESTGGSGSGDEGDVIGEAPAQPQQGQGDSTGPGQGE